jgi:hypothetical protein
MRFVPDASDTPTELVKEWRDGNVLFLAGTQSLDDPWLFEAWTSLAERERIKRQTIAN